jgi:hypothetical protein
VVRDRLERETELEQYVDNLSAIDESLCSLTLVVESFARVMGVGAVCAAGNSPFTTRDADA